MAINQHFKQESMDKLRPNDISVQGYIFKKNQRERSIFFLEPEQGGEEESLDSEKEFKPRQFTTYPDQTQNKRPKV